MRILMLGNSFTSANQMPQMLAALTGGAGLPHGGGAHRGRNPAAQEGRMKTETSSRRSRRKIAACVLLAAGVAEGLFFGYRM